MDNFDLLAADWRRAATDEKAYIEALAVRLSQALPHLITIERHFSFFSNKAPIKMLSIRLKDDEYRLACSKQGHIQAEIGSVVRGIKLKSELVNFTEWMTRFSNAIALFAKEHAESRAELERFLFS